MTAKSHTSLLFTIDGNKACASVTHVLMMTPSNGNIFRLTGPLWGEPSGHRWVPLTKASDAELWCFLWSAPEQTVEQTIENLVISDAIALIISDVTAMLSRTPKPTISFIIWVLLTLKKYLLLSNTHSSLRSNKVRVKLSLLLHSYQTALCFIARCVQERMKWVESQIWLVHALQMLSKWVKCPWMWMS